MEGLSPALTAYFLALSALFGLVLGSFCNNWAFRLSRGQSVWRGRSHCPACGHGLSPLDLIPLLSWLFLRGRCRYCKASVSRRYPLSELLSAGAWALLSLRFLSTLQWVELARWTLLLPLLFTLALQDWECYELSDKLILTGALWAFPLLLFSGGVGGLCTAVLGALSISGPLLLFTLAADRLLEVETMGGGDIKLFAMLGLHLGPSRSLLTLLLACVLGIFLGLLSRGRTRASEGHGRFHAIPFGPAVCLAAFIAGLWGEELISRYMGLFL